MTDLNDTKLTVSALIEKAGLALLSQNRSEKIRMNFFIPDQHFQIAKLQQKYRLGLYQKAVRMSDMNSYYTV